MRFTDGSPKFKIDVQEFEHANDPEIAALIHQSSEMVLEIIRQAQERLNEQIDAGIAAGPPATGLYQPEEWDPSRLRDVYGAWRMKQAFKLIDLI